MIPLQSSPEPELADFEAIEGAVRQTERGRWFLAEFARRNRADDLRTVLDALTRMEHAMADGAKAAETASNDAATREVLARLRHIAHEARLDGAHESAGPAPEQILGRIREAVDDARVVVSTLAEARIMPPACDFLARRLSSVAGACEALDPVLESRRRLTTALERIEAEAASFGEAVPDAAAAEPAPEEHPAEPILIAAEKPAEAEDDDAMSLASSEFEEDATAFASPSFGDDSTTAMTENMAAEAEETTAEIAPEQAEEHAGAAEPAASRRSRLSELDALPKATKIALFS
jgi:chemotaxis protein CheZ